MSSVLNASGDGEIHFYAGTRDLEELLVSPFATAAEVVAEVERLVRIDEHAAGYYRDNPHLQYEGHPWLAYVDAGHARYLGWEPGERHPDAGTPSQARVR